MDGGELIKILIGIGFVAISIFSGLKGKSKDVDDAPMRPSAPSPLQRRSSIPQRPIQQQPIPQRPIQQQPIPQQPIPQQPILQQPIPQQPMPAQAALQSQWMRQPHTMPQQKLQRQPLAQKPLQPGKGYVPVKAAEKLPEEGVRVTAGRMAPNPTRKENKIFKSKDDLRRAIILGEVLAPKF